MKRMFILNVPAVIDSGTVTLLSTLYDSNRNMDQGYCKNLISFEDSPL
jgi:hypothetical protein